MAAPSTLAALHDARPSSVCIVLAAASKAADWLRAHAAEDLTGQAPAPGPATIGDATTRFALEDLEGAVNVDDNLIHQWDRDAAVRVPRLLHEHGRAADPAEVYRWALTRGWPEQGAAVLRRLAAEVVAGRRPHRLTTDSLWFDEQSFAS